MRIGLVCPYDMGRPGGVQDQVVRLARWLRANGDSVGIIAPGELDEPGFVSVGPTTVVPANGAAAPVAISRSARRRVLAALDGFDVINVHEPLMPQVSLTALRHGRGPMVGTFHADTSRVAGLAYSLGRPITGRWIARLDVITAVSPVAARVVDYTRRARIVPNGIDVDDYIPAGQKRPKSVVFLGRDDPRKGLSVLLQAWREVRDRHHEATLVVLGAEGPDDRLAGITFAGRVTEQEKRRQLGLAAVYCAPNLSGESFGIVVAEGMAAGCAVVASALPAFVRVLGDAGVLVAPGDSEGLGDVIADLLDDPTRTRMLGESAQLAVRRFDGSVVAKAYTAAFEDAVALHSRR